MMAREQVIERVQQLERDLQENVTRRMQLRAALAQTTRLIERLQGAIGVTRELLAANGGPPEPE